MALTQLANAAPPGQTQYNGNYGTDTANDNYGVGTNLQIQQSSSPQDNQATTSAWINANNAAGQMGNLAGNISNQIPYYQNMQANQMTAAQAGAANNGFNANSQGAQAGQVTINTAQDNQDRAAAMQNISALQAQAAGQGPSVAAQQAQNSSQAAIAGQLAVMGSQRGAQNSALGLRSAANQAAANQQQTAQTAVTGRLQEQLNAQGQLGGAINNLQGQDIGLATNQAGLTQQTNLANANMQQQNNQFNTGLNQNTASQNAGFQQQANLANSQLQNSSNLANLQAQQNQQGMNNQMVSSLYGQEGNLYGNQGSQELNLGSAEAGNQLANQAQQFSQGQAIFGDAQQVTGETMQAMSMSDENTKTNIETISEDPSVTETANENALSSAQNKANMNTSMKAPSSSSGGMSSMMGSMMGGGGSGASDGSAGMIMSDADSKKNISNLIDIMHTQSKKDSANPLRDSLFANIDTSSKKDSNNPLRDSLFSNSSLANADSPPPMQKQQPMDYLDDNDNDIGLLTSDRNDKEDIHNEKDYEAQSFLDALKAHTFEYKDPKHGRGKFMGVMAQELEKTPVGKQAVIETKEGKAVDYGRLAQVMLASTVMLNNKVKQLRLEVGAMKGTR